MNNGLPPKFAKNYCRNHEYLHVIHLLLQIHSEYCCCVCCNSKYYTIFSKQSNCFRITIYFSLFIFYGQTKMSHVSWQQIKSADLSCCSSWSFTQHLTL